MWRILQSQSIPRLAFGIFTLIFCLYIPSFFNTFLWDDEQFIVKNVFTTSLKFLPQVFTTNTIEGAGHVSNYYRPLTTVSFTIDRLIWGLNPIGFHLTNTWLHAGVVAMFFILLGRLGFTKLQSFAVAVIYGIHPLATEAVTYMNSRGDSLSAFWLMVGLLAFDSSLRRQPWPFHYDGHRYEIGLPWLWTLAPVSFGAAVLAKEIAVAGIGLYFLLAVWHWFQGKINVSRVVLFMAALAVILAVYFGLRLTVLNFSNSLNFYPYENEYTRSLLVRTFTFGRVLVEYVRLIFVPYPLHMERDVAFITSAFSPWVLGAIGGLGFWGTISYWEWQRKRSLYVGLGGLWFLGLLVPVSGIVPINGIMYEHWLYLPLMGFLIALLGIWRLVKMQLPKSIVWMGWMVVVVGLSALTLRQNWIWRHPIPFYTYTLQYAESARLYNNLAMAYADEGRTEESIEFYEKALTQSNVYPQIYYNLARSHLELGHLDKAAEYGEQSLKIDPSFIFARTFLIDLYVQTGNFELAIPHLEALQAVYPEDQILRQSLIDIKQRAAQENQN